MPEWSTSCLDWEDRLTSRPQRSLIPFAPLFPAEAEAALDIFGALRIVDTAGRPTFREVARPWIMDFVASIFGAYDAETGRRLIQYFFMLISKKNGKSTLAAGIMVTALVRNWRESGEFFILAPTKEVADNSYIPARDMIMADPDLRAILKPSAGRVIEHRNTGAFLKVVAADSETVSGKKTIGLLVDELHVFGKRANAANMLLEATGGLASRPEGFVIYLSTQSDAQPAGVFKQKLKEFRDIRDGKVEDPGSLPVLYEWPKELVDKEAFRDEARWYVTNPNIGASVDERYLADQLSKAERAGKTEVIGFLAKHLNVEIGIGLGPDRWPGADFWKAQVDRDLESLQDLLKRSEVVVVGIDGGGLDDLLGLYVIGREIGTRDWLGWGRAWAHTSVLERRKAEAARIGDFSNEGDLVIVEQLGADILEIADICEEIRESGLLPDEGGIGVDPVGIGQIVDALAERDITEPQLVAVTQGWKLAGAIKTSERKLADGSMWHADQPLMDWCVGNARLEQRGNAVLITKQISGSGKIDPVMAMFDAVALMSMNPDAMRSAYEDHGLLVL